MKIARNITELIGRHAAREAGTALGASPARRSSASSSRSTPAAASRTASALAMIDAAERERRHRPRHARPSSSRPAATPASRWPWSPRRAATSVILTMPETMSLERRNLLRAYGAELVLTPGAEGMERRHRQGARSWPPPTRGASCRSSSRTPPTRGPPRDDRPRRSGTTPTAQVDVFVAAVGTGGTITGVGPGAQGAQARRARRRRRAGASRRCSRAASRARTRSRASAPASCPRCSTATCYDEVVARDRRPGVRDGARGWRATRACSSASRPAPTSSPPSRSAGGPRTRASSIVTVLCDTGERYLSTPLFAEPAAVLGLG